MSERFRERERAFTEKYPEFRELILTDHHVQQWFNHWVRGSKSVEGGLVELIFLLVKLKDDIQEAYANHLATYPQVDVEQLKKWERP